MGAAGASGVAGGVGAAGAAPLPGSHTSLPEPMLLTLHRARPVTRTSPEPMIVASTSPSEAKAALPDPAILIFALPALSASARVTWKVVSFPVTAGLLLLKPVVDLICGFMLIG